MIPRLKKVCLQFEGYAEGLTKRSERHQVVEGQVCDGITKNGLLDEDHIAAASSDLFYHLQDVIALLLQYPAGKHSSATSWS